MWGLKFEESNNSLLCGNCIFECSYRDVNVRTFRLDMQPEKWKLEELIGEHWKLITYGRRELVVPVVESILPKKKDYDKDWNWQQFFVALTFFDKGVQAAS